MTIKNGCKWGLAGLAASIFFSANTACAGLGPNPKDPYEGFNRVMFDFNEFLDKTVLKPVANLYLKIVPKPLVKGLSNVYRNIDNVPTILNDLLQANFYQATSDAWRLTINTTIGIGGLFDVAQRMGLEPNYEDFGLTLARWGYLNSSYLVIPFMGPSTIRDALSMPVNYYGLSIYPYIQPDSARYGIYFGGIVVRRADYMRYEALMQQISLDKYAFMRDAYLQRRNYLIQRNDELSDPYLAKNQLLEESELAVDQKTGEKAENVGEETHPFSDI